MRGDSAMFRKWFLETAKMNLLYEELLTESKSERCLIFHSSNTLKKVRFDTNEKCVLEWQNAIQKSRTKNAFECSLLVAHCDKLRKLLCSEIYEDWK